MKIINKKIMSAIEATIVIMFNTMTVHAATLQDVNNEVSKWVQRVGGLIMFIGVIKLAQAFKDEEANKKAGAASVIFAGFLIILICTDLIPLLGI